MSSGCALLGHTHRGTPKSVRRHCHSLLLNRDAAAKQELEDLTPDFSGLATCLCVQYVQAQFGCWLEWEGSR